MQVTIQVTDSNSSVAASGVSSGADGSASVSSNQNNGGAPSVTLTEGNISTASTEDLLNIGAPPQWLIDGLANNKANTSSTGSNNNSGTDAGAAPSFN